MFSRIARGFAAVVVVVGHMVVIGSAAAHAATNTTASWSSANQTVTVNSASGQDDDYEIFVAYLRGMPQVDANKRLVVIENDNTYPSMSLTGNGNPCTTTDVTDADGFAYSNDESNLVDYNGHFVACPMSIARLVLNAGDDAGGGDTIYVDNAAVDGGRAVPASMALEAVSPAPAPPIHINVTIGVTYLLVGRGLQTGR